MKLSRTSCALGLVLAWSAIATPSRGACLQDPPAQGGDAAKPDAPPAEAEKKEEKKEEEKDRWMAVSGGDVYTVTHGVLRGATVLAKNGVITDVGYDLDLPEGTDTLDATGLRVYPGLIACNSSQIVGADPVADNTDVFALNLILALSTGITTVVSNNTAAKLTYGTLEGLVLKDEIYVRQNLRGGASWRDFREKLEKVRAFQRDKAAFERRKAAGEEGLEEPKPQGVDQGVMKMVEGSAVGRFDLSDSHDLRRLAALSLEYGFKGVVFGAEEGWVVADELGRANLGCVITPRTTRIQDTTRNAPNGYRIENAAMLHAAGVPLAVVPGSAGISLNGLVGRDLFTLTVEGAYAVRGGLDRQAALESMTIDAARLLGVADRIGSIEVGKDADLIVVDGDILHYKTMTYYALVNGRLAYDKAKENLLSHIRPLEGESRFHPAEVVKALSEIHPADAPAEEKPAETGEGGTEKPSGEGGEGGGGDGGDGGGGGGGGDGRP